MSTAAGIPISSLSSDLTVINRAGERIELDIRRIRRVIDHCCFNLNVNPLELESSLKTRLKNGITTREIQENLIQCAKELTSAEAPDWRYVAGRLLIWGYRKEILIHRGSEYDGTANSILEKCKAGIYDSRLLEYSYQDLLTAQSWINPDLDWDYDLAGANLLLNRYLLPGELPQEAFLICSLLLALPERPEERLTIAELFYEQISTRKVSLPTPILANLRIPNGSLSSCFITAMDDNLESIFETVKNAARISKNGGGIGCNVSRIRAMGSPVMGKQNASGGVVPWIKLLNDTAIAVNQGGRRAGAITVSLDVWHLDILEFLEMQTENGDQRRKAYDIFPQVVISDEFMRRVINKEDWILVDPYEVRTKLGFELAETWGSLFEESYSEIEAKIESEITLYRRINARELFKMIMRCQIETGLPYLFFKDTANRANPNQHEGYIPGANLCVAPETRILTDRGQISIADLVDQNVRVWNGSEWSEVKVRKTGENQPLLKVHFSNGESLDCTYYHHFWVQDGYKSKPRRVEAKNLQPGDKLIKYNLPLVESPDDIEFPYAYTAGFFSGDGSYSAGHPEIDLYGKKKELLSKIVVRHRLSSHGKEQDSLAIYNDVKQDRIVCKLPLDIQPKYAVPANGYTIKSRLEWLAGLLDSDGSVSRNGDNESFAIASIHKAFLLEVRLMLQTLGIDSKVTHHKDGGLKFLPDNKGGTKEYNCQRSYRLLIPSGGLHQLGQLGLQTFHLKWNLRQPQREATQFIQVKEIELTCRRDDTYCFTEPLRHLGMFNGILTGQCTESWSNVKPEIEDHVCSLTSVNLANINHDCELEKACRTAVRLIDNSIDLTHPPTIGSKTHNSKYRTAGVGVMGLADWLARRKYRYTNLAVINTLFEDISFFCTDASADLAIYRGAYPAFAGSSWSQGRLLGNKSLPEIVLKSSNKGRWLDLQLKILDYGIRNSQVMAIAPNTSSALVQGCTAGILPPYGRFVIDKSKVAVPIAPPYLEEFFWFYSENKTLNQHIIVDAVAAMQFWVDTGISMELNFNLNAGVYFPEEPQRYLKASDIYDVLISAWEQGCKAIYYIRTVQKDSFEDSCVSCAN